MSRFLVGVEQKYPKELLEGRLDVEGNVISCMFKDLLLVGETALEKEDFLTADGSFYFQLLNNIRSKGFSTLDEVTILSNSTEDVIERYEERGGWEAIQNQIDIISTENFETYLDQLNRENIICNMYLDGNDVLKKIEVNGRKRTMLKMFRNMTADSVSEWLLTRVESYSKGYTNKIIGEGYIEFDDQFINDVKTGVNNGVPFGFSFENIEGRDIRCFPELSKKTLGLMEGTTTMLAGYSSVGKSTLWITILMALVSHDKKILIITNEEDVNKFKTKFFIWTCSQYCRDYKLTKDKFTMGAIDGFEDTIQIARELWDTKLKHKIKVIAINSADMNVVKKKIREHHLRFGFDVILYDTFKLQDSDMSGQRQDLALVRDSRELDLLAKKYNLIMLASLQLAEHTKGKLFLDSSVLSNSKQIKEVLEGLFLVRNVYEEEKDEKSHFYCRPFVLKRLDDGSWVEEKFEFKDKAVYRMLFIEKNRNGDNSSDTGKALLLEFKGAFSEFKEVGWCRPRHGEIR